MDVVVGAAHAEADAVLAVLDGVVVNVGAERLHQCYSGITVVVDPVVCERESKGNTATFQALERTTAECLCACVFLSLASACVCVCVSCVDAPPPNKRNTPLLLNV